MRPSLVSLSKLFLCAGLSLILVACAPKKTEIPALTGRVVDNAQTMQPNQQLNLKKYFEEIDNSSKIEIVVLTINSLPDNENIDSYSNKVFNEWKIGKKNSDSGILFLLTKTDRKVRIEVGRGAEGALPDMVANKIIKEFMVPKFKEGDFYTGFRNAAKEVRRILKNEEF